jgi:coproporphyrinogen dehydrogenase HemZ
LKNVNFIINSPFENDLMELIRAFSSFVKTDENADDVLEFSDEITYNSVTVVIKATGYPSFVETFAVPSTPLEHKKYCKRYGKIALYRYLSKYLSAELPYGSLTGVRPTKLYYELMREGDAEKEMLDTFNVSAEKVAHVKNIIEHQKGLINTTEKEVDVFVNIPFCPTRCAYCSFVAVSMKQLEKYVPQYVSCVKEELSILKNVILENSYKVRAVYFGGGTPTSLSVTDLKSIIDCCDFGASEFTVEAGRPDTVNAEMLSMLSDSGVTRISVNPQTFIASTLKKIGRAHTVDDTFRAYDLARKFKFDVNMDLIAALPDEEFADFKFSLDTAIGLKPENLTVHTLALKRGSVLTTSEFDNATGEAEVGKMIDYSVGALSTAGYAPYYMYRQKYVTGNMENSGYTLPGHACIYNIDIMEENTSILAAGAGSISKRVRLKSNRIERQADIKDVKEYIERFSELKAKKEDFWK